MPQAAFLVLRPIPTRLFSLTTLAFPEGPSSDQVLGVPPETFLDGLHFLTPLFLLLPQGFPFSSVHFSLNQRFRAAPFFVFRTRGITSCSCCPSWQHQLCGTLRERQKHRLMARSCSEPSPCGSRHPSLPSSYPWLTVLNLALATAPGCGL